MMVPSLDAYVNINLWQLFTVLLSTAILQEFIIKPGVELLKRYVRRWGVCLQKKVK